MSDQQYMVSVYNTIAHPLRDKPLKMSRYKTNKYSDIELCLIPKSTLNMVRPYIIPNPCAASSTPSTMVAARHICQKQYSQSAPADHVPGFGQLPPH